MKKILLSLCVIMAGLSASAQKKGDMAVGLNLGVAPCLESGLSVTNFVLGAKYQYNVTDPIRLEADLNYGFKSNYWYAMELSANFHYIFDLGKKFSIYPLAGIGYGLIGWDAFGEGESASRFLFNIGVGSEYTINENWAVGIELKYQYMSDFSRLPVSIGATYRF